MIDKLRPLLALLVLLSITACKKVQKDVRDYYPKVEALNATIEQDGSLTLHGRIISTGAGDMVMEGFCMDTLAHPGMTQNQRSTTTISGDRFSVNYVGLSSLPTYYFRSFAINEYGYAYGSEIVVDKPAGAAAPCQPDLNTFAFNNGGASETFTHVDPVDNFSSSGYTFSATTGYRTLAFNFSRQVTTGVYTLVTDESSLPSLIEQRYYVHIQHNGTNGSYSVQGGSKVYVKELAPGKIEVTVCDAEFGDGSGRTFQVRAVSPI